MRSQEWCIRPRRSSLLALGNAVQYKAALVVGKMAAHTTVLPPYGESEVTNSFLPARVAPNFESARFFTSLFIRFHFFTPSSTHRNEECWSSSCQDNAL